MKNMVFKNYTILCYTKWKWSWITFNALTYKTIISIVWYLFLWLNIYVRPSDTDPLFFPPLVRTETAVLLREHHCVRKWRRRISNVLELNGHTLYLYSITLIDIVGIITLSLRIYSTW